MEHCAIGSLGIMPYISATIIIQLLTAVWPKLSKLAREENGRTKIVQYGRYLTVLLCLGQGLFFAIGWEHPQNIFHGFQGNLVLDSNHIWWYRIQTVLIMTTGTMLLMWLGEQISDRGIGQRRVAGHHHRHCGPAAAGPGGGEGHVLAPLVAFRRNIPFCTGVMLMLLLVLWLARHCDHPGPAESPGGNTRRRRSGARCIPAARRSCRCA